MIPALLKWIGNKQRFADEIVEAMPRSFDNYYEPFLGSGAVLAELSMNKKTTDSPHYFNSYASDVLPFLIDLFIKVRDDPEDISNYYRNEIEKYNENSDYYYTIRDRFNENHNPYDFCVLSRTCYSGVIRFRKKDGFMSTPKGPHKPISPDTFDYRVNMWNDLIQDTEFDCMDFKQSMKRAGEGDVVYCDPPYTHSQTIIYGGQEFKIEELWKSIDECRNRGALVILSLNGSRESGKKDISCYIPKDLFENEIKISCGKSMIDRLHKQGMVMNDSEVQDRLLLTW